MYLEKSLAVNSYQSRHVYAKITLLNYRHAEVFLGQILDCLEIPRSFLTLPCPFGTEISRTEYRHGISTFPYPYHTASQVLPGTPLTRF